MAAVAPAMRPSPWLHGRVADLTLGAGLGYLLSIPVLFALRDSPWPPFLLIVVGLVINTQHYGATLLRVYEEREGRRRYHVFSVWVTLALLLLLMVAFHQPLLAAFLVTLYFTWSPWHFAGQNYGLVLTFLRRRGIAMEGRPKQLLHASFVFSFALTFLGLHAADSSHVFAQGAFGGEVHPNRLLKLGIPIPWAQVAAPLVGLLYLGSLAGLLAHFRRSRVPLRELGAPLLLIATQALWYSIPVSLAFVGRRPDLLPFSLLYISLMHSIQYLWITTYYARRADPRERLRSYLVRTLLAGSLSQVIPGLLLAPLVLSPMEWHAGMALLVFSVLNLHHFMLDGAIWKLRDGRLARLLLREEPSPQPGPVPLEVAGRRRVPWLRAGVWSAGAACAVVPFLELSETHVLDRPELARLERARSRLAWVRRDSPDVLRLLGDHYLDAGRLPEAADAYRRALEIRPRNRPLRNNLAWALALHPDPEAGRSGEAIALAEQALAAGPEDAGVLDTLAAAYAAAGRFDEAVAAAERGLELARSRGEDDLARAVRKRLALYRRGEPYREGREGQATNSG